MATTLTGRIRYRALTRLFQLPVLIVQVEERVKGYHEDDYQIGPEFDYYQWRDARIEDLTIIKEPK